MKHVEDQEQKYLFQWAKMTRLPKADDIEPNAKIADYLHANPNGGKRNLLEAKRLKAQGVKAGVSDVFLPISRDGYIGFYIELKAPTGHKSRTQQNQKDWIERMQLAGHRAEVHKGWRSAANALCEYLKINQEL